MGLYIGTTVLSWILMIYETYAIVTKIDSEGYKANFPKKTKPEKVLDWIRTIAFMSIPVANIFITGAILFKFDYFYKAITEDWKEKGKLVKKVQSSLEKNQQEIKEEIKNEPKPTKTHEETKIKYQNIPHYNRAYSSLPASEKLRLLELERNALLKEQARIEEENQTSTSPYDHGSYSKRYNDGHSGVGKRRSWE